MQQSQKIPQRLIIRQSNHHQSLQLNRLIKFIENKKSSSFNKLKHILNKNDHLHSDRQFRRLSIEKNVKNRFNNNSQSVTVNTKNIFVAKHKTQATTERMHQNQQMKYKVFITKQQLDDLYEGQKLKFISSEIKQKINSSVNKDQIRRSNLFPPLSMPKIKRAVVFQKYQDQATRWLNSQILNLNTKSLDKERSSKIQEKQQNQNKKIVIQSLQIQRQRYNKSLQKLIEKALKNKSEHKSLNSNHIHIIQGIEGYDSKLIVSGQQYEKGHESLYAQKGRLLTNPNIKIKKNIKSKSLKKTLIQNPVTMRNPQFESKQKDVLNLSNLENKKKIIHTNREAYYLQSSLKLKTENASNVVENHPLRLRKDSKTAKLIKQLQSSIMKSKQIVNKTPMKNQNFSDLLNRLQNNSLQKTDKNLRQPKNRKKNKQKTKTMHAEQDYQKTLNKWEIAGYDWIQSPQDRLQKQEIQKYVENLAKKSTKITFYKKSNSNQNHKYPNQQ